MKLDDLLIKEGMSPLGKKVIAEAKPEASERKRERPWLQNQEDPLTVESKTENYGYTQTQSTENGRKTYGKPTDSSANNLRKMDGKTTENLRKNITEKNLQNEKPTDTPTDNLRKMDGKPTEISSLVGFQRQTFFALAEQAKEFGFSDENGNRITPPVNGNIFALQNLQRPYKQVKDVIYELKIAGFLNVYKVKNGRGGFVQYLLQKTHYQAFLLNENFVKSTENGRKTYGKPTDKPTDKPTEAIPCSSSINKILNTTTTEPDFWLGVPKKLDGIVSVKQLREFVRQGVISSDELQNSLDGFAFDLEKGLVKAKNGNPVAILIGAIKGGGYISQQYLSQLKASLAAVEKSRDEMHKILADREASKLEAEFEAFRVTYPEEAEKLKPDGKFINSFQPGGVGYRMWLIEYKRSLEKEQNADSAQLVK